MAKVKKDEEQTPELQQLIKCTEELKEIKNKFGYQGASNPICVSVEKMIEENTKVIDANGK